MRGLAEEQKWQKPRESGGSGFTSRPSPDEGVPTPVTHHEKRTSVAKGHDLVLRGTELLTGKNWSSRRNSTMEELCDIVQINLYLAS